MKGETRGISFARVSIYVVLFFGWTRITPIKKINKISMRVRYMTAGPTIILDPRESTYSVWAALN